MNIRTLASVAVILVLLLSLIAPMVWSQSSETLDIRSPRLDQQGRFWVYRNGIPPDREDEDLIRVPPYGVPFLPYAWMSDKYADAEPEDIIQFNPNHPRGSHEHEREDDKCISVSVAWTDANWCGVGFVSGPDKNTRGAPWWARTNHGWYYSLSNLEHKRLVFHLRGGSGGERVQWKVGFLGHEQYGDSLPFPAVAKENGNKWVTLGTGWQRYTIDLSGKDLERVCSLCFIVDRSAQDDWNANVTFYIDTVYFE